MTTINKAEVFTFTAGLPRNKSWSLWEDTARTIPRDLTGYVVKFVAKTAPGRFGKVTASFSSDDHPSPLSISGNTIRLNATPAHLLKVSGGYYELACIKPGDDLDVILVSRGPLKRRGPVSV